MGLFPAQAESPPGSFVETGKLAGVVGKRLAERSFEEDKMEPASQIDDQLKSAIDEVTLTIIRQKAPQEVDIFDTISTSVYTQVETGQVKQTKEKDQIFSFSDPELLSFLTSKIMLVIVYFVIPFLKKVLEKAVDKTADKSVETVINKISEFLDRSQDKSQLPGQDLDLIVPINWRELEAEMTRGAQKMGFSPKVSGQIAGETVKELSTNQVLFGNLVVAVNRIPVKKTAPEKPASKKPRSR